MAPSDKAIAVYKRFCTQLASGEIAINSTLGETQESLTQDIVPSVVKAIGFEITPANIEKAFQLCCHSNKQAMIRTGTNDYERSKSTFLIAGNSSKGESLRNGNVKSWLLAIGLEEKLQQMRNEKWPYLSKEQPLTSNFTAR